MTQRRRLAVFFAVAGLLGGASASVFLKYIVGPGALVSLFLYGEEPRLLLVFPFIGALLAAAWSTCFTAASFGPSQGTLVAFLSFETICALVAARRSTDLGLFLLIFVDASLFGFILVGWAVVLIGTLAGHLFRSSARGAL